MIRRHRGVHAVRRRRTLRLVHESTRKVEHVPLAQNIVEHDAQRRHLVLREISRRRPRTRVVGKRFVHPPSLLPFQLHHERVYVVVMRCEPLRLFRRHVHVASTRAIKVILQSGQNLPRLVVSRLRVQQPQRTLLLSKPPRAHLGVRDLVLARVITIDAVTV